MSTAAALRRPALNDVPAGATRVAERLRLVPPLARATSSLRVIYLAAAIVTVFMLAQLGLSIVIAQGAYEMDQLEGQRVSAAREASALEEQVNTMEAPSKLTTAAEHLGMAPAASATEINPATGALTPTGGRNLVNISDAATGLGNAGVSRGKVPASVVTSVGVIEAPVTR